MKRILLLTILFALLLSACTLAPSPSTSSDNSTDTDEGENDIEHDDTLVVMTHDSFAVSEEVIKLFEDEYGVDVEFLASGDTGAALNKAILSKEAPLADVFFGVDNTFLSRALDAELFEPYDAPGLATIPEEFKLDVENRALPVTYGDVCINYDKAYFLENDLAVPQTFEELMLPEYAELLVVENPATSSPGLAFLLASVAHFGTEGYLDFWAALEDEGVSVASNWESAYYSNFSASSGRGPQALVVSYATSPAAEVYFSEVPLTEAPTASILGPDTCFRQIEFVGILAGTPNRAVAEAFVDFLLSVPFQEDIPLQMFVYPVNPEAKLPDVFVKYAELSEQPANMSMDEIAKNRDAWIQSWTETVLK